MTIRVKKRNGRLEQLDLNKINECVERACEGLTEVSASEIALDASLQLYDKATTLEIDKALVFSAASKIEKEPNYSYVAARLLLNVLYKEVIGKGISRVNFESSYRDAFRKNLKELTVDGRIAPEMLERFDLSRLALALKPARDNLFKYHGIQTLYDRYFLHIDGKRKETPQALWMRVAMGLSLREDDPTSRAIEFYEKISQLKYLPSTPTLFNSGTTHPQLSSCYLSTFEDSIDGIFGGIHGQARLSKYAGGLGNDFTPLRATNSHIKGTNGKSSGVVPWMKVYNDMLLSVDQGGKRKGAGVAYLESWHLDIEEFFELRKNTGDDRRRCHDMHTAHWVCDLFLDYAEADRDWYLFCPHECPELHDSFGTKFREAYEARCREADAGKLKNFRIVKAKELWKRNLVSLKETGHPWITFKDPSNTRYPNQHEGVVHSSNLCCMTADQLVATSEGLITVGELYETQKKVGVVGREQVESASRMMLPRPNAPIVKIVTHQGYTHKVTPDHKVWVKDIGWVEAKDLEGGDEICIQQYEGMTGKNNDPELAFIIGLIMGDGAFDKDTPIIDLWSEKYFDTKRVEKCVSSVIERYLSEKDIESSCKVNPKFVTHKTINKARMKSKLLGIVLDKVAKYKKETKLIVPNFILRSNKETISAFLEGLYVTDGTVTGNDKMTTASLSSSNMNLLQTIQIILANFGIKSSIYNIYPEGYQKFPNGNGKTISRYCNATFRLMVNSIIGCKILEGITKIGKNRKHEQFLKNIEKDGRKQKLHATFSHLERLPKEDAYCLRVDSDEHSWTVNGLITKNTEITLHTKASKYNQGVKEEVGLTAVCNLASINLASHLNPNRTLDFVNLAESVMTAVRGLDNVIDINFYPIEEAKKSNLQNRPVGLGLMGWHDVVHAYGFAFDSKEAVKLAEHIQEWVSFFAIKASADLARERGAYETFEGSTWAQGKLPIDSYESLMRYRGRTPDFYENTLDWDALRTRVAAGMRNSNVMAIAPTATISYIAGCSQSIEPDYSVLFVYSTLSGNFVLINEWFVRRMKEEGLWGPELVAALKQADGDVRCLKLPANIHNEYKTPFDMNHDVIIDGAAARQRFIDMGQSLNIYYDKPSLKGLNDIYIRAWKMGLKSTYYLRSKAASKIEKNAAASSSLAVVEATVTEGAACSRDNPDCESCQ